jgi:hypothetical protein
MDKEGEEVQTKGIEDIKQNNIRKIPRSVKEMTIYEQNAFRSPNRQDQKRNYPHHTIVKTSGIHKERLLSAVRETHRVTCKGKPIGIITDFSKETVEGHGTMYFKP